MLSSFVQSTHSSSSALTGFATSTATAATKSATGTEKVETTSSFESLSVHADNMTNKNQSQNIRSNPTSTTHTTTTTTATTDQMKPTTSTVSTAATNQVVHPLLGSDDDHPQLSTDLQALISELAVVIGASSAVTIVTLTREVTKAIDEIQEELWEVRNVYAAPLGMRMPAKVLGRMSAPLLNSVRIVLRAELRKTLPLRRRPGGPGTGRKAWVNLIARSLAKRLTDQLVACATAEAPAGMRPSPSC
jgi:hypothetical protein